MTWTPWIRALAAVAAMTVALSATANAAELLMYRTAGCPWCAKWDEAIGPIYPKTEVGRRVPLRVVHSDKESGPDVALLRPVRYSPTFVLVDNGREVGRIEGYPGEDFFWGLLENLVLKLPRREATIGAAAAR